MDEPTVTIGNPGAAPEPTPAPPESTGALFFELGQAMADIRALREEVTACRAEQSRLNAAVADLANTLVQTREELALVITEEVDTEEEIHQEARAAPWERMLGAG